MDMDITDMDSLHSDQNPQLFCYFWQQQI